MNARLQRLAWLCAAFLMAAPLFVAVRAWPGRTARASSAEPAPSGVAPPAKLRIRAGKYQGAIGELLDPRNVAWEKSAPTAVLLNRTPRIYQTEPVREIAIPALEVRALGAGSELILRLRWSDATRNAPQAPPRKRGEGGEPAQLYKRPTAETATFPDAAAVMIPKSTVGATFPSLMMGDQHTATSLYYWNASRGAEEMTASGRATPKPTGAAIPFRAVHEDGKWTLTMQMLKPPDGCPLAFAIWDGELGDRDGLKFFSIWYVLLAD